MSADRTNVKVRDETHERGKDLKREGETWSAFLERAFDALEDDAPSWDTSTEPDWLEDATFESEDALTERHIDDIVARTARKTAIEVENRLR